MAYDCENGPPRLRPQAPLDTLHLLAERPRIVSKRPAALLIAVLCGLGFAGLGAAFFLAKTTASRVAAHGPRTGAADYRRCAERIAEIYNHLRPGEDLDDAAKLQRALSTVAAGEHRSEAE